MRMLVVMMYTIIMALFLCSLVSSAHGDNAHNTFLKTRKSAIKYSELRIEQEVADQNCSAKIVVDKPLLDYVGKYLAVNDYLVIVYDTYLIAEWCEK